MQTIHEFCAGLDVHKKTVVACVCTPHLTEVRTFGTMTADLLELSDWLVSLNITHVAMESTGEYWKPISTFSKGCWKLSSSMRNI